MPIKTGSFKNKVLIPIIIVFIISVLIISAINYRLLCSSVRINTNDKLDIFTNSILAEINHLDIILDTTTRTLNEKHIALGKSIAYILENTSGDMSPETLKSLAKPLDIIELSVADSQGILTNSNVEKYIGFDYNSQKNTKAYMALTDGRLSEFSEELRVSEADLGTDGDLMHYTGISRAGSKGFIQLGFDASVLSRLKKEINIEVTVKDTKIGENGYGIVLSNGIILAHPNTKMLGMDVSGKDWYNDIKIGNGFAWLNIDGVKYYAGYKNTDGNTVIGLVPERDFYKEINQVMIDTLVFLSIAIIIMIAVVYLILDKLLKPVKELSEGLGIIAKGNFDARIAGKYNDEFDIIKDAVNSMAIGIKTYLNDKMQAERAAHESILAKGRAEAAREAIVSSIEYASKIQKNLLPPEAAFQKAFADYSIIWNPKDIVGGDIYWIKNYDEGSVLCVCDCTGHGTHGALLTMLVVSILGAAVNNDNCKDTAQILWELEKRLTATLNVDSLNPGELGLHINDGCDIAIIYVAKNGEVNISAGNTKVFVCNGSKITRVKGQRLRIGEGAIKSKDVIKVVSIPPNPDNKYYIASDGLYEQIGGEEKIPFGYDTLERIILENHNESQSVISRKIWQAFEDYRGENPRRDDFELITFKPRILQYGKRG